MSGKLIFEGWTAATGTEIYVTDDTPGSTTLVKDINTGVASSIPADFVYFNDNVYFAAITVAEGRELWKTNGTLCTN
ncbi:MAG: hypothetical protein V4556_13690 [Bacteroidota bacterium]